MPINKSFKIPFFNLLLFSLVIAFLNSNFILYKGTSESLAKLKPTFPDYMLTIMFFIKYIGIQYIWVLKLIQA